MASTVVLINVNPAAWLTLEEKTSVSAFMDNGASRRIRVNFRFEYIWRALIAFCNTISIAFPRTALTIIVYHSTDSCLIWRSPPGSGRPLDIGRLSADLATVLGCEQPEVSAKSTCLPLALTQALCLIHAERQECDEFTAAPKAGDDFDDKSNNGHFGREKRPQQQTAPGTSSRATGHQPRILVIETGVCEYAEHFSELLTLAFAAQKNNVVIDVFTLGIMNSAVCHHLSDLTGGVHLSLLACATQHFKSPGSSKVKDMVDAFQSPVELAQIVLSFLQHHLAHPVSTRAMVLTPSHQGAQSTAICWCHKRQTELAAVCSCCLTIFCDKFTGPICPVCRIRFRVKRTRTLAS